MLIYINITEHAVLLGTCIQKMWKFHHVEIKLKKHNKLKMNWRKRLTVQEGQQDSLHAGNSNIISTG